MALLSFSVMREKLDNYEKTGTCRIINHMKVHEMRCRAKVWHIWWKSRTKEKAHLYDVKPEMARRIQFFRRIHSSDKGFYGIFFPSLNRPATPEEERVIYTRDGFSSLDEMVGTLDYMHGESTFKKEFGNYLWVPPKLLVGTLKDSNMSWSPNCQFGIDGKFYLVGWDGEKWAKLALECQIKPNARDANAQRNEPLLGGRF